MNTASIVHGDLRVASMILPSGVRLVDDYRLHGHQAVAFMSEATASGQTQIDSPAGALVVRARGEQCKGAPEMTVAVDNVERGHLAVPAPQWTDYPIAVALEPGMHTVSVSFTNDRFDGPGCDRNLYLDDIRVVAQSFAPPSGPAGSAKGPGPGAGPNRSSNGGWSASATRARGRPGFWHRWGWFPGLTALGLVIRTIYGVWVHPAWSPANLYSDMEGAYHAGKAFAEPHHVFTKWDTVKPRAMGFVGGFALRYFKAHGLQAWGLLQIVLSAATLPLCYLGTQRYFGRRAAIVATAFLAVELLPVEFAGFLMVETYLMFFLALSFALLVPQKPLWCLGSGLALGIGALFKPQGLPLLPLWCLLLFLLARARAAAAVVCHLAAFCAPATLGGALGGGGDRRGGPRDPGGLAHQREAHLPDPVRRPEFLHRPLPREARGHGRRQRGDLLLRGAQDLPARRAVARRDLPRLGVQLGLLRERGDEVRAPVGSGHRAVGARAAPGRLRGLARRHHRPMALAGRRAQRHAGLQPVDQLPLRAAGVGRGVAAARDLGLWLGFAAPMASVWGLALISRATRYREPFDLLPVAGGSYTLVVLGDLALKRFRAALLRRLVASEQADPPLQIA